jgi:hypothetical protein
MLVITIERKKTAIAGNRTQINFLERNYAHHYTTSSQLRESKLYNSVDSKSFSFKIINTYS